MRNVSKTGTMWHKTIGNTAITGQMEVSETDFDTTSINSPLVTTKCAVIPPFTCKQVKGMTKITGHSKWIHVVAEPLDEPLNVAVSIKAMSTYAVIQYSSTSQNDGMKPILQEVVIPAKTTIGQVQAANMVPNMLLPNVVPKSQYQRLGSGWLG